MPEKKVVKPTTGKEKYPISRICWKIFLKYQGGFKIQEKAVTKKMKKCPILAIKLKNLLHTEPIKFNKKINNCNHL